MRKHLAGLLVGLLALAGAACGDSESGGGGGLDTLAAAADAAQDAGSARMEMSMSMETMGQTVRAEASGVFDMKGEAGRMTMSFDGPGLEGTDIPMKMIIHGDYVYLKGSLFALDLPKDTWARQDVTEMPGVGPGGLSQWNQDPTQYLEFLRAASNEVEEVGTEDVRGTRTTHYRAELDFEKILDQSPDQEGAAETREQLESMGDIGQIPADIWIDEQGLPRRMEMTMSIEDLQGLPEGMTMVISMEMFDYGIDVDVKPPKRFEAVDIPFAG